VITAHCLLTKFQDLLMNNNLTDIGNGKLVISNSWMRILLYQQAFKKSVMWIRIRSDPHSLRSVDPDPGV